MVISILFALITATNNPGKACDLNLIHKTLKQVEIADYVASATPQPPAVLAQLYTVLANKVAECAGTTEHFMNSALGDYLQAAKFSVLSGNAYFDAGNPSRGCTMLREGQRYFGIAYGMRPSSHLDYLALKGDKPQVTALRKLLSSKCQRE